MTLKKVVQDSSGIVGLFNVEQAAQNIYLAMHAIQHRGQDGVGLAISDGENVVCKKGLGLLSENLKQDTLNSLEGNIAIGQLRMATKIFCGCIKWDDHECDFFKNEIRK